MNHSLFYHTLLAGWCAESAGAQLEFQSRRFTQKEALDAMRNTDGRITDDSEMELCLLEALVEGRDDEHFPLDRIADKYIQWYQSDSLDVGQTVTYALLGATNEEDMQANAEEYNDASESNGSLMRCVPIALFGVIRGFGIQKMASIEASLTHSSNLVKDVSGIYGCLLASILRGAKTPEVLLNYVKEAIMGACPESIETLNKWFLEGVSLPSLDQYDAITDAGHVKHAFVMVIFFVSRIPYVSFEQAIAEVLKCGGDTDTNAKIVGNLFGAYYGDCVPAYLKEKVISFQSDRPECYQVQHGLKLLETLDEALT